MSKYSEALEILVDKAVTKDVVCLKEYNIIKEASKKAEKYDELTKEYKPSPVLEKVKMLKQERDEALKRCEELEKENAELLKANSYNNDITNKISTEKHKLELNYKVLVDGVKVLLDVLGGIGIEHCKAYDDCPAFDFYVFGFDDDGCFDIDSICKDFSKNEYFYKIKSMLELVEVIKDE